MTPNYKTSAENLVLRKDLFSLSTDAMNKIFKSSIVAKETMLYLFKNDSPFTVKFVMRGIKKEVSHCD